MKQRDFGFLQSKERAYLANHEHYPASLVDTKDQEEVSEAHAKHRIQSEAADISIFMEGIAQFRRDLAALQAFQRADGERWHDWESIVLPAAKHELETLRDRLDLMINLAEREDTEDERAELQRALAYLRSDLELANLYERYPPGSYDDDDLAELLSKVEWDEDRNIVAPQELVAQFEEKDKRDDALVALLRKVGLIDVLEEIDENGRCVLPEKKAREGTGQSWTQLASQFLTNEYGLLDRYEISSTRKEFELTNRGKTLLKTWRSMKESDAVAAERVGTPVASDRTLVRNLLDKHFNYVKESEAMAYSNDL